MQTSTLVRASTICAIFALWALALYWTYATPARVAPSAPGGFFRAGGANADAFAAADADADADADAAGSVFRDSDSDAAYVLAKVAAAQAVVASLRSAVAANLAAPPPLPASIAVGCGTVPGAPNVAQRYCAGAADCAAKNMTFVATSISPHVPVNYDRMQVTPFCTAAPDAAVLAATLAAAPAFRAAVAGGAGQLGFAIVTDATGAMAEYPGENWTRSYGCVAGRSCAFDPRGGSWYTTAATPPLNLVLAVCTSCGQLETSRAAAAEVVARLDYWHQFAVLVVSDHIESATMTRATRAAKAAALAALAALEPSAGDGIADNMVEVLRRARDLFAPAEIQTGAANVVFWVGDDGAGADASRENYADIAGAGLAAPVHVFSFLANETGDAGDARARRLACATGAIYVGVSSAAAAGAAADRVFGAIAGSVNMTAGATTQLYFDEAENTSLISAGAPLYVRTAGQVRLAGVVGVDMSGADITDAGRISPEAVAAAILGVQTYQPLAITEAVTRAYNGPGVCEQTAAGPAWAGYLAAWVVGALVLVLAAALVAVGCAFTRAPDAVAGVAVLVGLALVAAVVAMGLFFGLFWPQLVREASWEKASFATVGLRENPYQCCRLSYDRGCTNACGSPPCSRRLADRSPGVCEYGYRCCSRRKLGNSYVCSYSVACAAATVVCGTCRTPSATFRYTNLVSGAAVNVSRSTSCGADDLACVTAFFDQFAGVGGVQTGWYNPANSADFAFDNGVDWIAFGFACALAGVAALLFIGALAAGCAGSSSGSSSASY